MSPVMRFIRWLTGAEMREEHDEVMREWAQVTERTDKMIKEDDNKPGPSPEERVLRIKEMSRGREVRP